MTVKQLIKMLQDCNPEAIVKFWGKDSSNIEIYSEIKGIIKDSYGDEVNILDEKINDYLNEQIF